MAKGKQMLYTQQGYQELVDELHRLKHEKREEIKNAIATARGFGDLSENAEYDEARNEQAKNETRIKELEELLENAVILDESSIDTSVVSLGSTVKLFHEGLGMEMVYDLVGSNESNPAEGKISDQSPIGEALIGKREGDSVQVEVPNGTVRMKILAVSRTQN
ncbi:MAG: transcription elongation factor GreA [Clostridia bacterium]|jgi:transcription elongation factor GreA|nr:transcription elongation factor GreA [Clostridia bacterium]MBQ2249502.1 transcription elongation factor GreA [Clostridia bacterium]MBQ5613154.1 transcription elongation factor GreA [Clostridia bacterium]MBQ5662693.1 transcription elongation factor GreA [Clostridia bacterium]MBQ5772329.1 transcription elongation factor GreA [Clostridia bacterium]